MFLTDEVKYRLIQRNRPDENAQTPCSLVAGALALPCIAIVCLQERKAQHVMLYRYQLTYLDSRVICERIACRTHISIA